MAQVRVTFDGFKQLVGGIDPQPQFVALVALELRDLVLARPVRVDRGQVLDDPRQRFGQQPVIDQIQHQAHGKGPQHPGNENNHRVDDKPLAISGGIEGDAQVAVVLAVGAFAYQGGGEGAFLAKNQIGQPAAGSMLQGAAFFREHGFVGMANGGHAHRIVLEQPLDDLHAHLAVQAIHRLGRRVAEHIEDALGIAGHGLARLVGIKHDLRHAQRHAHDQRRQQHNP